MRSLVPIPLARGLGQALDERVRAPDQLAELTNGYFSRQGALVKRHGFTELPATVAGGRGVHSSGDELLVRGYRSLYSWDSAEQVWRNRGPLSPFVARQRAVFADAQSYPQSDSTRVEDYVGHVAARNRQAGPDPSDDVERAVVFRVSTTAGHVALSEQVLAGPGVDAGAYVAPRAPKVASVVSGATRKIIPTWLESTPDWSLRIGDYDLATPAAPATVAITHADAWQPPFGYREQRTHDVTAVGANYGYAYVHSSQAIAVYLRNAAHGLLATTALGGVYVLCAMSHSSASGLVYVATVRAAVAPGPIGPGTDGAIELWALDEDTLGVVWGPKLLRTLDADEEVYGLGVAEGMTLYQGARVSVAWTKWSATEPNSFGAAMLDNFSVETRSYDTSGANIDALATIPNAIARTAPFYVAARCYVVAHMASGGVGYGATCAIDVDHPADGHADRTWAMAARYDVGLAPVGSSAQGMVYQGGEALRVGALNGTWQRDEAGAGASLARAFASTSLAYAVPALDQSPRFSADVVELDGRGLTTAAQASTGAAIFGGAYVGWFSGATTEESGFSSPPLIALAASYADAVGQLVAGTYHYCAVWEGYDDEGTWHRSGPSEVVSVPVAGAANAVGITVRCLSGTSRLFGRRAFGPVIYRAETDGVFERITAPSRFSPATTGYFVEVYRDLGPAAAVGPVLYTQGGAELEAAGPDGASLVLAGADRVFLAGFPAQDRIAFSKRTTPATAGEDAIAPEFSDAFAFVLPGDERCTGLAELDDKIVAFTARAIYALAGRGPDDGGRNSDYSGLQPIAVDGGCVDPRSVVTTPRGVVYRAAAGFYLLDRGLQVSFVGEAVRDLTDAMPVVSSAVLVPDVTQVRFTVRSVDGEQSAILVYDYRVDAWSQWIVSSPAAGESLVLAGACLHQGVYHVIDNLGRVLFEDASAYRDCGAHYVPMTVATSWIQAAQQSGWQRVRTLEALCARKDAHALTVEVYQDFEATPSQAYTWSAAQIAAMAAPDVREQIAFRVRRQKSTAFRVRVTDAADESVTGEGYTIAGFTAELGAKRGLVKASLEQRN